VSTQLRLVDTNDITDRPAGSPSGKAASSPRRAPSGSTGTPKRAPKRVQKRAPIRAQVTRRGGARGGNTKRTVRWTGDLRLDDRTRTVGRAGIAAAREALERVAAEQARARSEQEGRSQKAS
jgi:hypothetical protein